MIAGKPQDDYFNILDNLSKSRKDKKKEEYLKKIKEKKAMKKQNKKSDKQPDEPYNEDGNLEQNEDSNLNGHNNPSSNGILNNYKEDNDDLQKILQEENIEIEYVEEDPTIKTKTYENFKNVFDYFVIPKKEKRDYKDDDDEEDVPNDIDGEELDVGHNENNFSKFENPDKNNDIKLGKKRRKLMGRMKTSELKQYTEYPEIVEGWDVTAKDPIFLIRLKSMRNTVPVPKHWAQKRQFLASKRGIVKQPFKLPDYIEATGISKVRDTTGNDRKSLKQKMRERMQPKLGRMDIDYQVLHDAFFKYQTKTALSGLGEVYYENKEYENKMKLYRPGRISEKLRIALGIPENSPPPWIINMQRYGAPPSYPNLKIPGVNAPLCDPTAVITPNLWTPPSNEVKQVLVYDYSNNKAVSNWGDLREVDEEEASEDYNDDASLSDHGERPMMDSIFNSSEINMTGEDKFGYMKVFNNAISQFSQQDVNINLINAIPNPNANIIFPNYNSQKGAFTTLEQATSNIKQNEIVGSSYTYVVPKKMDDSFLNIDDDEEKKNASAKVLTKEEKKVLETPEVQNNEKEKEAIKQKKTKNDKYMNFKF